jgi:hypothetical protein
VTPGERLLAAADLLDKRAREATAGPWTAEAASSISVLPGGHAHEFTTWLVTSPVPDEEDQRTAVVAAERNAVSGSLTGGCYDQDDAVYIATLDPEVGSEFAEWLRCAGRRVGGQPAIYQELLDQRRTVVDGMLGHALNVADRILAGEAS